MFGTGAPAAEQTPATPPVSPEVEARLMGLLDAPLLFTKRHSYSGIHIYDTYYKWPPGGGGIYVLENPSAPRAEWKIRPLIDPTTPGTLGLGAGLGLAICRDRKVDPARQRIHLLWKGYAHAVQPPEKFPKQPVLPPDPSGEPLVSFASTADPNYQAMLAVIRDTRQQALATPRIDMPGAEPVAGACRLFVPPLLPETTPPLEADVDREGIVHLAWECSGRTIGLEAELHRSTQPGFTPDESTLLVHTPMFRYADYQAATGRQHYALRLVDGESLAQPTRASVTVPPPVAPPTPVGLTVPYRYQIQAVGRRGAASRPTAPIEATATFIEEPVFAVETPPEGNPNSGDSTIAASGSWRLLCGSLTLMDGEHALVRGNRQLPLAARGANVAPQQ